MKNILFVTLSFVAAVLAMSSCSKEAPAGYGNGGEELLITATIASAGTRVTYAEQGSPAALHPSWQTGDVVIGFDNASNTYGLEVTGVDGTGKATLKVITSGTDAGSVTDDPADGTVMYMIYAPGKHPSDINVSAKSLTVSLASQSADIVPALMMAQATVADSKLSLVFSNETVIVGLKDPVMYIANKNYTALGITATTSASLGINTEVVFSLDGGNLKATYQTPGDITKAVNFTSNATTKKGPAITWLAVCPLSSPADLYFVADDNESYGMVIGKLEKGHYYHTTPVFGPPEMGLDFNDLTDSGLI